MAGLDPLAGALISAGSGLLGIVLGGVITVWGQQRNERLRFEAAREAGLAVLAVEARDALKLVYDVRDKDAWPISSNRSWTQTWLTVRGAIFARPADTDELEPVAEAFTSIDELEHAVNSFRDERSLKLADEWFLLQKQHLLERALTALGRNLPDKPSGLQGEDAAELMRAYRAQLDAQDEAERLRRKRDNAPG